MALTRSRHRTITTPNGYTGPLPQAIWEVVRCAWEDGIAVSSNVARELSAEVALAASLGWISTVSLDGRRHTRVWNVTAEGVTALNHKEMME